MIKPYLNYEIFPHKKNEANTNFKINKKNEKIETYKTFKLLGVLNGENVKNIFSIFLVNCLMEHLLRED